MRKAGVRPRKDSASEGMQPPVFPGEPELAHEADEFIDLEQMMECARLYAQALYRLMTC